MSTQFPAPGYQLLAAMPPPMKDSCKLKINSFYSKLSLFLVFYYSNRKVITKRREGSMDNVKDVHREDRVGRARTAVRNDHK